MIAGANSGNIGNANNYKEFKPDNPKLVDDKYLKKNGVNAHKLKDQVLGSNNGITKSNYNIYVDKKGDMWLLKRGSKNYIPTYESIHDYNQ
jgi:filamentous hemagglutinin